MSRRSNKTTWLALTLAVSACVSTQVHAEPLGSLDALSQEQFIKLSENLAAATHYKGMGPAESLGLIGFDVGIELSSTEIEDDAVFDVASDGDFGLSEMIIPRVHVNKGLPFGFDLGATLAAIPETDITVLAGEVRYAIFGGGVATPAVAVRGSYAMMQGLSDLDMNSAALEITASKGFVMLTPYVGAGIVRTKTDPAAQLTNLSAETIEQNKLFAGVTISLGFALTLEADVTGDVRTYSAKAGIRF